MPHPKIRVTCQPTKAVTADMQPPKRDVYTRRTPPKIPPVQLAALGDDERAALLMLAANTAWANQGASFTADVVPELAKPYLEPLVAAGHLIRAGACYSASGKKHNVAYQLKPVSVVMAADWRRGNPR